MGSCCSESQRTNRGHVLFRVRIQRQWIGHAFTDQAPGDYMGHETDLRPAPGPFLVARRLETDGILRNDAPDA